MLVALGNLPTGVEDVMAIGVDPKPKLITPTELDTVLEQARGAGWRELALIGPPGAPLLMGVPASHTF
jgi:hypothetical protein